MKFSLVKDGMTHLAPRAEHVMDLNSDLLVVAKLRPAGYAAPQTLVDSGADSGRNPHGCRRSDRHGFMAGDMTGRGLVAGASLPADDS